MLFSFTRLRAARLRIYLKERDTVLFFLSTRPGPRSLSLSLIINFMEFVIVFIQRFQASLQLHGN